MTAARRRVPVRVDGEVLTVKRAGGYTHLTIVADRLAQLCRPGAVWHDRRPPMGARS